jgi:hypothetical protein
MEDSDHLTDMGMEAFDHLNNTCPEVLATLLRWHEEHAAHKIIWVGMEAFQSGHPPEVV